VVLSHGGAGARIQVVLRLLVDFGSLEGHGHWALLRRISSLSFIPLHCRDGLISSLLWRISCRKRHVQLSGQSHVLTLILSQLVALLRCLEVRVERLHRHWALLAIVIRNVATLTILGGLIRITQALLLLLTCLDKRIIGAYIHRVRVLFLFQSRPLLCGLPLSRHASRLHSIVIAVGSIREIATFLSVVSCLHRLRRKFEIGQFVRVLVRLQFSGLRA
jgi:hypothetical protein